MTDTAAPAASNVPEYSVSELSHALKRTVEDAYGFVRVRGELGRVLVAKSGHLYTDLKDDKAVISSVMWKGGVGRLSFKPEEGLEVVVEGKLSTYPGRSQYQLIVERMAPAGVGALMALLEERKKKLAAEGLFAEDRKRAIPRHPEIVGVVTSPTGAVFRDILHRVAERFPRHVLIWPALVQGQEAAAQIAAGIEGFNALQPGGAPPRPDVLIVARGGGSIEDLWPFNEEIVVRAAAASAIPLISAVGHETDWTLIDLAADLRAPTPTGAAEIVTTPPRAELAAGLETVGGRIGRAISRALESRTSALTAASRGLPRLEDIIGQRAQRLDMAAQRLRSGLKALADRAAIRYQRAAAGLRPQMFARDLAERRTRLDELAGRAAGAEARVIKERGRWLEQISARLASLDPKAVLKRGFSIVRRDDGEIVQRAADLRGGEGVVMEFSDGPREAVVSGGASGGGKARRRKRGDSQGALF